MLLPNNFASPVILKIAWHIVERALLLPFHDDVLTVKMWSSIHLFFLGAACVSGSHCCSFAVLFSLLVRSLVNALQSSLRLQCLLFLFFVLFFLFIITASLVGVPPVRTLVCRMFTAFDGIPIGASNILCFGSFLSFHYIKFDLFSVSNAPDIFLGGYSGWWLTGGWTGHHQCHLSLWNHIHSSC